MGLHILPKNIMHLVNMIICIICPALKTYNLLINKKEKATEDTLQYIHFLTYWILYSFYTYFESAFIVKLMNVVPFYGELKIMFFFWLYSDTFQGAGYLYFKFIEKHYSIIDKKICDLIQNTIPKNVSNFFYFEKSNKKIHNKIKSMVSKKDLY
ncbi:HVA22-like protein, putative [Plasmodium sp. gorilla clade G3]|nr:HVA22-like protein, putative [Plasmodium sp. gorilla clade G3]